MEEVRLPKGLRKLIESTFLNCYSLRKIDIPNCVRKIEKTVFWHCNDLAEICLPKSLSSLGEMALPYALESLTIHPDNKYFTLVDDVLYNKDMTELVVMRCGKDVKHFKIPDTVTKIGRYAFRYCDKLESVELPAGLLEIGEAAFDCCKSLKKVVLPGNIQRVERSTFFD